MSITSLSFLKTIFRLIEPNIDGSISMYDVGAAMDLSREESEQIAQLLMADRLVDVRTLAGAIGLTPEGLAELESAGGTASTEGVSLGVDGIASPASKNELQKIVAKVRTALESWDLTADDLTEIAADLATIEAQLASPKPKNSILRAIVESLLIPLGNLNQDDPAIERLTGLLN